MLGGVSISVIVGAVRASKVYTSAMGTWFECGCGLCVFHGFSLVVVEESLIILLK